MINLEIGRVFSRIGAVQKVYVVPHDHAPCVWIVVNSLNESVREQILDAELTLFDRFPDLEFSFDVVRNSTEEKCSYLACEATLAYENDKLLEMTA